MTEPRDANLSRLADDHWSRLLRAASAPDDAWHTMVVASVDGGAPEVRTVVLRHCEPGSRRLSFHTDCRSAKARQLATNPAVSLLFWDPDLREQLRCGGGATLHSNGPLARRHWERLPERSRALYRQPTDPGAPLDDAAAPEAAPGDADEGREHFLVVSCTVDRLDWLQLDGNGHHRARWTWRDGAWDGAWVSP